MPKPSHSRLNRYTSQRPRRTPPHVALGDLRAAAGLTLDEVCARVEDATGLTLTRGALSAIENGHRGASAPLLRAIALAYGIREDAITTDYAPRSRSEQVA